VRAAHVLIHAALDIYAGDPAFGYRFIADEPPAHEITAGENRVARLCSQQRIRPVSAKKRGLAMCGGCVGAVRVSGVAFAEQDGAGDQDGGGVGAEQGEAGPGG
jgi:hypothetical protein